MRGKWWRAKVLRASGTFSGGWWQNVRTSILSKHTCGLGNTTAPQQHDRNTSNRPPLSRSLTCLRTNVHKSSLIVKSINLFVPLLCAQRLSFAAIWKHFVASYLSLLSVNLFFTTTRKPGGDEEAKLCRARQRAGGRPSHPTYLDLTLGAGQVEDWT